MQQTRNQPLQQKPLLKHQSSNASLNAGLKTTQASTRPMTALNRKNSAGTTFQTNANFNTQSNPKMQPSFSVNLKHEQSKTILEAPYGTINGIDKRQKMSQMKLKEQDQVSSFSRLS